MLIQSANANVYPMFVGRLAKESNLLFSGGLQENPITITIFFYKKIHSNSLHDKFNLKNCSGILFVIEIQLKTGCYIITNTSNLKY